GMSAGYVFEAPAERPFIRGDAEENGAVNISDAITVLQFLFLGGDDPTCLDAADIDDDGQVNITDAIRLLNFLFLGGLKPAAPYPDAGCDATDDALGCGDA
ncbi:MAG: dockerin type I domain-containing protein, partial [Planctomycetota bacterium]